MKMQYSNSIFDDFVRQKTEEAQSIDWGAKKELWLTKVNELYSQIKTWLNDWIINKKIIVSTDKTVSIVEEYIGQYQIPVMNISIGSEEIELIPIGTLIIGSQGRIDVIGKAGNIMLILTKKHTYSDVSVGFNPKHEIKENKSKKKELNQTVSKYTPDELTWKYVKKSPQPEYFELNSALFEEILMAVSGN